METQREFAATHRHFFMDFHGGLRERLEAGEEIEGRLPGMSGLKTGSNHFLSSKSLPGSFYSMGEKPLTTGRTAPKHP